MPDERPMRAAPSPKLLRAFAAGALALGLAANTLLVRYALRPIWELEHVASRVWAGDFAARVPGSDVADREMSRVGRTFNLLLDAIARDRERMRALALQTVRAQDDERSRIARAQMRRATRPMTEYSGSMPLEKKNDRLGAKSSMSMPRAR